jgi:hypothetical protein
LVENGLPADAGREVHVYANGRRPTEVCSRPVVTKDGAWNVCVVSTLL